VDTQNVKRHTVLSAPKLNLYKSSRQNSALRYEI